jgi:methionyl-tRNA formyltransferase
MFDTIILLMDVAERCVIGPVLQAYNPLLALIPVGSSAELAELTTDVLERARLISFVTAIIVPQRILARLGYGAFNFHPGPPRYPGWAPSHFALYEGATEFGATVHVMVEKVDAGPIIDVALFPIPDDISVPGLEGLAYAHLAKLFWLKARSLATDPQPPPTRTIQWGARTYSRRAYQAMCDIPLDIPRDEFDRRLRIFGANHFGISPTITLHGVEFRPAPASTRDAPHVSGFGAWSDGSSALA